MWPDGAMATHGSRAMQPGWPIGSLRAQGALVEAAR